MAIARVGDTDLYYDVSGAGDGLPVLLLMGLGTDSNGWERQVPVLGRARRVVVMDNRGVGRSGKPKGPYTTAALAADAVGVLDALGMKRAHVIGCSLGGAIAQELVLGHPDRVASLTLIATFPALDAAMERTANLGSATAVKPGFDVGAALRGMAEGKVSVDPSAVMGFLMPLVFSKGFMETERAFLVSLWQRALEYGVSADGFAGQVAAVMAHDTRSRLASIATPTLVMTGDRDKLVPPALSKILAAAIPGARLVEIQGGTHGMTIERADDVNAVLETWLAQNDGQNDV
jgi:pimeloyl-ACP methyl ester carboxylesterase